MVAIKVGDFLSIVLVAIGFDCLEGSRVCIGTAFFDKFFCPFLIDFFSFALKVGGVLATNFWPFVPL